MERIMKKNELADELAIRCNFYKKNMKSVLNALEDIIIEHFETATYEEPSVLQLAPGILICGRRVPEHESINPQDRSTVVTPEKVIPYAEFKPSVRQKLYVRKKKGRK